MAFTSQQQREHRAKLKTLGICVRCHKRKTEGLRLTCDRCGADVRDRRTNLFESGLCRDCMAPLDDKSLIRCINCSSADSKAGYWRKQRARL